MRITTLVENVSTDPLLGSEHGLSLWIETRTKKIFVAKHWFQYDSRYTNYPALIVVIFDSLENEIDRYLWVRKPGIGTKSVWVNKDDDFTLSFNFQTTKTSAGNSAIPFGVLLDGRNGQNAILSNLNGVTWEENIQDLYLSARWSHGWSPAENANKGISVSIENENNPIPFDAKFVFTFFSGGDTNDVWGEHQFRDFKFNYVYKVNKTTKIIGQSSTHAQAKSLLNVAEGSVNIDSAPRFQISGSIYSDEGILATLFKTDRFQDKKLGDILNREMIEMRANSNLVVEGAILSDADVVNLLELYGKFFSFINFEKNIKTNEILCKFIELELRLEVISNYIFEYKYES